MKLDWWLCLEHIRCVDKVWATFTLQQINPNKLLIYCKVTWPKPMTTTLQIWQAIVLPCTTRCLQFSQEGKHFWLQSEAIAPKLYFAPFKTELVHCAKVTLARTRQTQAPQLPDLFMSISLQIFNIWVMFSCTGFRDLIITREAGWDCCYESRSINKRTWRAAWSAGTGQTCMSRGLQEQLLEPHATINSYGEAAWPPGIF